MLLVTSTESLRQKRHLEEAEVVDKGETASQSTEPPRCRQKTSAWYERNAREERHERGRCEQMEVLVRGNREALESFGTSFSCRLGAILNPNNTREETC